MSVQSAGITETSPLPPQAQSEIHVVGIKQGLRVLRGGIKVSRGEIFRLFVRQRPDGEPAGGCASVQGLQEHIALPREVPALGVRHCVGELRFRCVYLL
jgi:hypothetical protein